MPKLEWKDIEGADLTQIPRGDLEELLVDALFLHGDDEQTARLQSELARRNVVEYGSSAPFDPNS